MKKILLGGMMLVAFTAGAASISEPLWLRNTAVSPDGKTIAFTFRGDIFTVPTAGGEARRLTNSAYNTLPVWSPSGKSIAFASDREGSLDIYLMDSTGGTPQRITTNSGNESPLAFLNDSTILYSSMVQPSAQTATGPFLTQVYSVEARKGARPRLFMSLPAVKMNVDGGNLLYQDRKGYEDVLRKHERSAGTADIWLLALDGQGDAAKGKFRKLTTFDGQNQNPVWNRAVEGEFFYTSEEDGTLNVYKSNVNGEGKTQLTSLKDFPVRSLSASDDGKTLAFSYAGEIYTLTPGEEPVKVPVAITSDYYTPDAVKSLRSSGATNFTVSPTGEEVAFIMRGNVYVTSVDFSNTKQITSTPAQERTVSFSPDGKTLVYDSERDGIWQLFTAKIKDPKENQFAFATEIVEEPLYKSDKPAFQPAFSPDGKKVAFLEDRTELKVLDMATKEAVTAMPGEKNYSYTDGDLSFEWSPDSQWLLSTYMGEGGWNNADIALVKADGTKYENITLSGYEEGDPHWAMDGAAMTWESDRNGYRSHGSWGSEDDVYVMFFDPRAYDRFNRTEEEVKIAEKQKEKEKEEEEKDSKSDKKKDKDKEKKEKDAPKLAFDLDNAKYRTARLTGASERLGEHYLDKKGEKLYYINSKGLWVRNLKDGETKMLVPEVFYFEPAKDGEFFVAQGRDGLLKVTPSTGEVDEIEFEAPLAYNAAAEREYIYDHMLRQVSDKFYDVNLHGVDWEKYGTEYRRFLPYISNNYDYAEFLSEILGELNASHTGGRYRPAGAAMKTATLGAFFDETWNGDGLAVVEILPMGPLATGEANVKPGDVIMAIDGEKITAGQDYFPMLEGKAGKKVRLTVARKDGKEETVYVKPVNDVSDQLYRRWVERNRAVVDSLSGGKVGYVHVRAMDSESFRRVYEEMLGKYRSADAIIVDTRFNSGGWLHNDLAVLLSGKEYVRFTPRGKYIGSEPFSQWFKPSVMLINEGNYSDGHGAPYVYKTLGLGTLVGAPIPGTMTAVWWETQIDPTLVFGIPQTTNSDLQGQPLENHQLQPDILIYNTPEEELNGRDAQLAGAVKHLLEQIKTK